MYVPLDITALNNNVVVYIGGEVPDIMGILLDDSIPDGPVHVMATSTDETLDKSALNATVHVRVTSSPEVMGLFKSLVIVTMVGSGTACGTHVGKYIIIKMTSALVLVLMIH